MNSHTTVTRTPAASAVFEPNADLSLMLAVEKPSIAEMPDGSFVWITKLHAIGPRDHARGRRIEIEIGG